MGTSTTATRPRLADFAGETLTVEQAGRVLGISRGSAYEAARAGELPTIRIGHRLIVPRHRLAAMLGLRSDEAPAGGPALREDTAAGVGRDVLPAG